MQFYQISMLLFIYSDVAVGLRQGQRQNGAKQDHAEDPHPGIEQLDIFGSGES
jgi:hypothetical protein